MKKGVVFVLMAVMMLGILTACTAKDNGKADAGKSTPSVTPTPARTPEPMPGMLIGSGDGYSNFASELYSKSAEAEKDNFLISPASAYFALSMAANGSDAETQKAFEIVLGMPVDQMNAACEQLLPKLRMRSEDGGRLNIANAVWLNETLEVGDNFINTAKEIYEAEIFESMVKKLNCVPQKSVKEI